MSEFKQRLNVLFRLLRKQGYLAKQNFACCGGCACAELAQLLKEPKNLLVKGAVYYHQQDADRLKDGYVYLGFGGRPDGKDDTLKVGIDIVIAASHAGLVAEWNGQANQRVKLEMPNGD